MIYMRVAWTRARGSRIRGARGGFLSVRPLIRSLAALLCAVVIPTLSSPAFARQDPCSENGPDCRLLTSAEINALKGRLLALRAKDPAEDLVPGQAGFIFSARDVNRWSARWNSGPPGFDFLTPVRSRDILIS